MAKKSDSLPVTTQNHDIHPAVVSAKDNLIKGKNWFTALPLWIKIVFVLIVLTIGWFTVPKLFNGGSKTTYQTDKIGRAHV